LRFSLVAAAKIFSAAAGLSSGEMGEALKGARWPSLEGVELSSVNTGVGSRVGGVEECRAKFDVDPGYSGLKPQSPGGAFCRTTVGEMVRNSARGCLARLLQSSMRKVNTGRSKRVCTTRDGVKIRQLRRPR
jgi:hypothetical protein